MIMDEAYDADRYRLTALLVEHHRVNELQLQLRDVVEEAIESFGVSTDAELHGTAAVRPTAAAYSLDAIIV